MKIIFATPFNPLWSKDVSEIASLLDAKVVSIGNLLRAEVKSNSVLGKDIETAIQSGELLSLGLASELLAHNFFDDSVSKVLVNYPIKTKQAESLAKHIQNSAHGLDACVFVNVSKCAVIEKFISQFHCVDSLHPKLETAGSSNPECEICGKPMVHSYDLKNDKVAHLIDSYFDENGALSAVSTLNRLLGVVAIPYTTPMEVVNQLQNLTLRDA